MRNVLWRTATLCIVPLVAAACGDGDDGGAAPLTLIVTPEFVQGIVPGERISVLVSVEDTAEGGDVALKAAFPGGAVSVEPQRIAPGGIAEVRLTADAVTGEVASQLTVTATRGTVERTAVREVIVVPFDNDREEMAVDVLALFTPWLAQEHPDLGITPESDFEGAMVAPRLLVVSHYMFENDAYEIGVAWHVMVAPDDWAEIYVRPRDALYPARAFRVSSWSTAMEGGEVEFTEVAPPPEVVR